jgi:SMC interacting uncharacterized protein involved in chromosome segregation
MSYNYLVVRYSNNKLKVNKMDKELVMFDVCEAHIDLNTTLDVAITQLQQLKDMFITDRVIEHTLDYVGDEYTVYLRLKEKYEK